MVMEMYDLKKNRLGSFPPRIWNCNFGMGSRPMGKRKWMVRKSEDEESGLDKLMVDCCVASPWKRMEGRLAGKKNDLGTMTLVRNKESGLDKSLVDCCVASESSLCRFESDASFLGTPSRDGGKGLAGRWSTREFNHSPGKVSRAPPKRWRDERMKSLDQHHGGVWTNQWERR